MSGLAKLCIMICQTLQNPNLILKVITRDQKKKKSSLLFVFPIKLSDKEIHMYLFIMMSKHTHTYNHIYLRKIDDG